MCVHIHAIHVIKITCQLKASAVCAPENHECCTYVMLAATMLLMKTLFEFSFCKHDWQISISQASDNVCIAVPLKRNLWDYSLHCGWKHKCRVSFSSKWMWFPRILPWRLYILPRWCGVRSWGKLYLHTLWLTAPICRSNEYVLRSW